MTTEYVGNLGVLVFLRERKGAKVPEIAKATRLSEHTIRHHLDSLRRWGQARAEVVTRPIRAQHKRGWALRIPVRSLRWFATERGLARLRYKGL